MRQLDHQLLRQRSQSVRRYALRRTINITVSMFDSEPILTLTRQYVITGILPDGRRFKPIHTTNYAYARGHNIWNGTLWEVTPDGSRHKLHRWFN